jgi:hypothetical protein
MGNLQQPMVIESGTCQRWTQGGYLFYSFLIDIATHTSDFGPPLFCLFTGSRRLSLSFLALTVFIYALSPSAENGTVPILFWREE